MMVTGRACPAGEDRVDVMMKRAINGETEYIYVWMILRAQV